MRIVQFSNGKFGIEKGIFIKEYADRNDPGVWWGSFWANVKVYAIFDTKEAAEKRMVLLEAPMVRKTF